FSFELLVFEFEPETFLGEVGIRSVRILIGLESISPLAKPFITLPLDSYFVCTQSTEPPRHIILHLSGSRFSLFLLLTPPRLVPNVWHFPYFVGATSTNSLMIKLQPKIYDYIILAVSILFIPSVCSSACNCDLFARTKGLLWKPSRAIVVLMVFKLFIAALSTPRIYGAKPSPFLIYPIIEFAIFVALIVQVREEGWTSRMRKAARSRKRGVD
ncbi:hypothetical protein ZWY2020_011261, partial [Hordeum vulgare]